MKTKFFRENAALPLIVPTLIIMAIFTVVPLIEGIRLSFTNANLINNSAGYIGFKNYAKLFTDNNFWAAFAHSLILTSVAVFLQLCFGTILALALKQNVPGIKIFRSIIMASWVIPVVATAVIFTFMVEPDYGYYNILLNAIGIKINKFWFGSLSLAFPLIIVLHLWRNVPFYGIAFLAAMQAISRSQYEAVEIDGAGPIRSFFTVTLPGIRGMILVIVTIHVLWTFNNFSMVYLTTGGGPVFATEVLPVYLYNQAWSSYATGYASAIGTIMFIVLMIYFVIYIRFYQRQES